MNLVIRAHTLKTEPLSQPITGHFDERGGTIGRSDTNTLALPDPERHISRLQAEVWFSNGAFSIRNVGSANSITVNGRPVNPGEGATLSHGDELTIGAYAMRAAVTARPVADTPVEENAPTDARTVIKASAVETRTNPRMAIPPSAPPSAAPAASPVAPPAVSPAVAQSNPFGDLLGNGPLGASPSGKDPFADLMGGLNNPPTTGVHVRVTQAPPPPITVAPAPPSNASSARLPDDFDPFADLPSPAAPPSRADSALASFMNGGASPASSPVAPSALPADLGLGELLGAPASAPGSSLDAMFGLNAPGGDPLAFFMAAPPPGSQAAAQENKDPLAMFGVTPAATAPPTASSSQAIPADFNHTPEMQGAYRPPAVQAAVVTAPLTPKAAAPVVAAPVAAPQAPPKAAPISAPLPSPANHAAAQAPLPVPTTAMAKPPPAAPVRSQDLIPATTVPGVRATNAPFDPLPPEIPPASNGSSPDALWAAFCQGAGISLKLPQGLTPELMRVIGQVMHHSIDGTIKLVAVRAAAKQELRADVTTIQARNNNPLKFSPDAGAAIEQLLQPPMRGFMMGPVAVDDAMDDLLGHAIGTMAGMRAALTGVLERFEPKRLEGKLAGNSMLDAVLPMNRRAKLWELYLQHYQRIRDDAQDDFHDLFGRAFIDAYEEQLDRLDAARHPAV